MDRGGGVTPMTKLSPSLRKAAVLLAALDEHAADALLLQMGADEAAKVRSALAELDEIPADEQQQVLAEFLRRQGAPALAATQAHEDVSLQIGTLLERSIAPASSTDREAISLLAPPGNHEPLAFLQEVAADALADILRREHPQTIAVVVAHLPPGHAAALLQALPPELATDALERMAALDELSPEVCMDLARGLRQALAPHLRSAAVDAESLARLSAVLEAMDFRQRQQVVLQLADRNTFLLRRLGLSPPAEPIAQGPDSVVARRYRIDSCCDSSLRALPQAARRVDALESTLLAFDELALLDDTALRAIFAAADPQLVLLALTGADPKLLTRILQHLPARQAAILRQRLEHPGPVRLRDIEQAQEELAQVASRLARQGSIALPRSVRFAAAV
jgi:flagellar motor switch protein FliG